jgi:hypothetical protein
LVVLGLVTLCLAGEPEPAFAPVSIPGQDLVLQPESERRMQRVVVGLDSNLTRMYMVPSTEPWDPRSKDPRVVHLRRQLYWLNFELHHGRIFAALPPHTTFFVAVPDASLTNSLGNEREVLAEYLSKRVGWTDNEIGRRIRFYTVPGAVPYPQDLGELLGRDSRDRLVVGLGDDIEEYYLQPALRLAAAFPEEFTIRMLPGVNTEGGDLELAWLPNGKPGVLVGHHRIRRWLERHLASGIIGRRLSATDVEKARTAFREAFFGLEVVIVGQSSLVRPRAVSDELFHMDMVLSVLRVGSRTLAFVPSYVRPAVDAIGLEPLSDEVVERAQLEYDAVAAQMADLGYGVVRLPFADHPVRNPVNIARYVSPQGRTVVLLGKYPYHRNLNDGRCPQREIQNALDTLASAVDRWHSTADDASWQRVTAAIDATWKAMDEGVSAPNPTFALQAGAYRAHGVEVTPVPVFASGEGGLHCTLLQ